jgi:rhodanese-related sulfurtransferase
MKKTLATIALALTAVFGLAACAAPAAEPTIAVTADTVVVDVRTSDEYSAGHLEGAVNIDVQSPDFDSRLAELPKDGEYVVYCASGNRSSSAAARMESLGFTNVIDGGGISEAAGATGLDTVTTP